MKEEKLDLPYGDRFDIPKDCSKILDVEPLSNRVIYPGLSDAKVKSSSIISNGVKVDPEAFVVVKEETVDLCN